MDRIICPFEVKTDSDNTRTFVGYGAVFGNIDSYGDTIAEGAFAKTLASAKSGATAYPAMLLQHGDDTAEGRTPVGLWLNMIEDHHGLRVSGKLANTQRGRDAYELLKLKPRPALNGLSIGFRARNYTIHTAGLVKRTLTEIELVEVSLVTFPANSKATVLSVKAAIDAAPAKPYTMADLARDDFKMLSREMTKHNRSGW